MEIALILNPLAATGRVMSEEDLLGWEVKAGQKNMLGVEDVAVLLREICTLRELICDTVALANGRLQAASNLLNGFAEDERDFDDFPDHDGEDDDQYSLPLDAGVPTDADGGLRKEDETLEVEIDLENVPAYVTMLVSAVDDRDATIAKMAAVLDGKEAELELLYDQLAKRAA